MSASFDALMAGSCTPGLFSWRGQQARDLAAEATQAGWTVCSIDTTHIESMDDFYIDLANDWGLPPWFGGNLDALFDVLMDRVADGGPTVVIWDGLRDLMAIEPMGCAAVMELFRDAVAEADRLAVIVRGDLGVSGFDALL